jgi:uncharacterized membrane protein
MSDSEPELGPIDYVLIEFPGTTVGDEAAQAFLELIERGLVRVLDLVIIRKEADGSVEGMEVTDLSEDQIGSFTEFHGAGTGLLGESDITEAAEALEPDTMAVFLVYENTWAAHFTNAARRAGGQLIASGRIPAQTVLEALDAIEAAV